jgi:hypothetical protein
MSEIEDSFKIARDLLAYLEDRFTNGESDAESTKATMIEVVGALASHGRPERTSDKPPRGVGYGQMGRDGYTTPDEAMIVASLSTLALSPIRDTLTRGFSHFVTSMTAVPRYELTIRWRTLKWSAFTLGEFGGGKLR